MSTFEFITDWVNVYATVITLWGALLSTKRILRLWRTRHLRKVWGIKNGDSVIVVCSELEDPEERQLVEPPREFIYSLKYGDVDAYFEVVTTLLRLYPAIKLRIMSAGEATTTRMDLAKHLILIGGPDYNALTKQLLDRNGTQFDYRSPYVITQSDRYPEEIVLYDKLNDKEYCFTAETQDYGYFERIVNPHNPKRNVVLIGGCHTIGVTGAAKAFSMAESEEGEIPRHVLSNAASVAKQVGTTKTFAVLVPVERVGQTISTPVVQSDNVTVRAGATGDRPLKNNSA